MSNGYVRLWPVADICLRRGKSAFRGKADIEVKAIYFRFWPIVLKKSAVATHRVC
jgi:hypothetical protein